VEGGIQFWLGGRIGIIEEIMEDGTFGIYRLGKKYEFRIKLIWHHANIR
jgi:hypothetical protein